MFYHKQSSRYGGLLWKEERDVKPYDVFNSSGKMCIDCVALTALEQEQKSQGPELNHQHFLRKKVDPAERLYNHRHKIIYFYQFDLKILHTVLQHNELAVK